MPRINLNKIGKELARNGGKICEAKEAGGYSRSTAKRGWTDMGRYAKETVMKVYEREIMRSNEAAIRISEKVDTKALTSLVRGSMIRNLGERSDKGIQTIKTAASLAETGMIRPVEQAGVIIIQAVTLPSIADCPKMPKDIAEYHRLPEEKQDVR